MSLCRQEYVIAATQVFKIDFRNFVYVKYECLQQFVPFLIHKLKSFSLTNREKFYAQENNETPSIGKIPAIATNYGAMAVFRSSKSKVVLLAIHACLAWYYLLSDGRKHKTRKVSIRCVASIATWCML